MPTIRREPQRPAAELEAVAGASLDRGHDLDASGPPSAGSRPTRRAARPRRRRRRPGRGGRARRRPMPRPPSRPWRRRAAIAASPLSSTLIATTTGERRGPPGEAPRREGRQVDLGLLAAEQGRDCLGGRPAPAARRCGSARSRPADPSVAAEADQRARCPGCPGAAPRCASTSSSSAISGTGRGRPRAAARAHRPAVTVVSKPALLHRRADDQAAVGAGHHVDALAGHDPLAGRLARPEPRRVRISPFTGRTGGRAAAGSQSAPPRPAAGREHDALGGELPPPAGSPRSQPGRGRAPITSAPACTSTSSRRQRGEQRGDHRLGIDDWPRLGRAAPPRTGGARAPARAGGSRSGAATPSRVRARGAARGGGAAPRPRRGRAPRAARPGARSPLGSPLSASSSAANPGQRSSDARLRPSRAPRPRTPLRPGRACPPRLPLAPARRRGRARARTRARPRRAARHAQARPITPPPTNDRVVSGLSVRSSPLAVGRR